MAVVGIICEYNPFHNGHAHQFDRIRSLLPDASIVCLMSGPFTQRGLPALHAPLSRAEAALRAGADVVLELPCAAAVSDAERFALAGVDILTRLRFVTHLSFGAEDDLPALAEAAALLEHPTPLFTQTMKNALANGVSLAAAQSKALDACLPHLPGVWQKPNNILGICYLRAISRLSSPLVPLTVLREGSYHETELTADGWPSATAVRNAFLSGRFDEADAACPVPLPRSPVCKPDALDTVLLYKLRSMTADRLARLPDCTEGLENRLLACAREAATRKDLLARLKTKRYAYARLSRLCTHALLDIDGQLIRQSPTYVRLLGFRKQSRAFLSEFNKSAIPVLSKASDGDPNDPLFALDCRAYDLWALGAGLPAGLMFTQGVTVV